MRKRVRITAFLTVDTDEILEKDGISKNSDDSPVYIHAQDSLYAMTSDFLRSIETPDSETTIEVTMWN